MREESLACCAAFKLASTSVTRSDGGDGGMGGSGGGGGGGGGGNIDGGGRASISLVLSSVASIMGEQSDEPAMHGRPVASLMPHAAVQFQPLQELTNSPSPVPKYQPARAVAMLVPSIVNSGNADWPERQCTRQLGLKTPVPGGRAAMSARVPV